MPDTCVPGPRGSALQQTLERLQQDPLGTYHALQRQFGDVVCLETTPQPLFLLCHPDAVQHVLRDSPQNYRKGMFFQAIAALQGEGLLTSEGERWRRQRRLLQPLFHAPQLATLAPLLGEEIQGVLHGWQRAARAGEPVNVTAWMHRFTFRVLCRALLGLPATACDTLGQQLHVLGQQIFPHLRGTLLSTHSGHPEAAARQQAFQSAIAAYQEIAQHILASRQRALEQEQAADLIAILLYAQEQTGHTDLHAQRICDEIITFIGAGTETSAQALSWALYLLALHPEVRRGVEVEIEEVVGEHLATPDDLGHLPYSRMVIDETLRLYPPAALVPRQANIADTVQGFAIPQDAIVLLSPYLTQRHPDFWPAPDTFTPQRFTTVAMARQHRFAYFPFGAGARLCIGKPLALLEMHLALVALVQAYTWSLPPQQSVVPELATTLRPRGGLWLTVQARHRR